MLNPQLAHLLSLEGATLKRQMSPGRLRPSGAYKVMVMNRDGTVAEERPFANNLILDQGINNILNGTANWANCFAYCAVGTGTGAPAVSDTSLGTEVIRTANYLTGAGNCGTSNNYTTKTSMRKRTFDFPAEVSPKNYTELGWSHSSSPGANLFSRTLISGGTVTVLAGQSLRVVYELTVQFPNDTVATPAITGWPVAPSVSLQGTLRICLYDCIATVTTTGTSIISSSADLEINGSFGYPLKLSTVSALPSYGSIIGAGTFTDSNGGNYDSYTPGSFVRTRYATWTAAVGNRTDWRAIIGYGQNWIFLFDQAQTKDNLHTLRINWQTAISR